MTLFEQMVHVCHLIGFDDPEGQAAKQFTPVMFAHDEVNLFTLGGEPTVNIDDVDAWLESLRTRTRQEVEEAEARFQGQGTVVARGWTPEV